MSHLILSNSLLTLPIRFYNLFLKLRVIIIDDIHIEDVCKDDLKSYLVIIHNH